MKIVTDGYICLSKTCQFKAECANHETAGDFRTEDGFSPELSILPSGEIDCKTTERKAGEEHCHGVVYVDNVPENYKELNHGFVTMKISNGKKEACVSDHYLNPKKIVKCTKMENRPNFISIEVPNDSSPTKTRTVVIPKKHSKAVFDVLSALGCEVEVN